MASKLPCLLDTASKFALFSVSGFKDEKFTKSKPTWKLKHANSILETSEYFCQKSSKSICTFLSYTVSKLVHFLRHSVELVLWTFWEDCIEVIPYQMQSLLEESTAVKQINCKSAECMWIEDVIITFSTREKGNTKVWYDTIEELNVE